MLENYRKIAENNIFDKILHDERQKKAFLKNESRKIENLLEYTGDTGSNLQKLASGSDNHQEGGLYQASTTPFMVTDFLAAGSSTSTQDESDDKAHVKQHSHYRQY